MPFSIMTSAFKEGETIPKRYTGTGEDWSPMLQWNGAPPLTKSFVLIVDDPDAPRGTWLHWLVFNIPSHTSELAEAISSSELASFGAVQGMNDFGKTSYGGPLPPPGKEHRYYFRLFALDTLLEEKGGATLGQLNQAMKGHVLADTHVMGRFQR